MTETDPAKKPPMTVDEIRELISNWCDGFEEVSAAISTELKRNDDGWIVDDSDLGIAVRELEHVTSFLSRLSFNMFIRGVEAAPPNPNSNEWRLRDD